MQQGPALAPCLQTCAGEVGKEHPHQPCRSDIPGYCLKKPNPLHASSDQLTSRSTWAQSEKKLEFGFVFMSAAERITTVIGSPWGPQIHASPVMSWEPGASKQNDDLTITLNSRRMLNRTRAELGLRWLIAGSWPSMHSMMQQQQARRAGNAVCTVQVRKSMHLQHQK